MDFDFDLKTNKNYLDTCLSAPGSRSISGSEGKVQGAGSLFGVWVLHLSEEIGHMLVVGNLLTDRKTVIPVGKSG